MHFSRSFTINILSVSFKNTESLESILKKCVQHFLGQALSFKRQPTNIEFCPCKICAILLATAASRKIGKREFYFSKPNKLVPFLGLVNWIKSRIVLIDFCISIWSWRKLECFKGFSNSSIWELSIGIDLNIWSRVLKLRNIQNSDLFFQKYVTSSKRQKN